MSSIYANQIEGPTHSVRIQVIGRYPHGERPHATVEIAGDGDVAHMLEAFQASLVAAGFSVETAARLGFSE